MYSEIYKTQLTEYEKFWKRENKKRIILNASAPKERNPFCPFTDINEKWLSEEYNYQRYKHNTAISHFVAEGVPTAKGARALAQQLHVETPIINEIYRIIYENRPVPEAVKALMNRDAKPEE